MRKYSLIKDEGDGFESYMGTCVTLLLGQYPDICRDVLTLDADYWPGNGEWPRSSNWIRDLGVTRVTGCGLGSGSTDTLRSMERVLVQEEEKYIPATTTGQRINRDFMVENPCYMIITLHHASASTNVRPCENCPDLE